MRSCLAHHPLAAGPCCCILELGGRCTPIRMHRTAASHPGAIFFQSGEESEAPHAAVVTFGMRDLCVAMVPSLYKAFGVSVLTAYRSGLGEVCVALSLADDFVMHARALAAQYADAKAVVDPNGAAARTGGAEGSAGTTALNVNIHNSFMLLADNVRESQALALRVGADDASIKYRAPLLDPAVKSHEIWVADIRGARVGRCAESATGPVRPLCVHRLYCVKPSIPSRRPRARC